MSSLSAVLSLACLFVAVTTALPQATSTQSSAISQSSSASSSQAAPTTAGPLPTNATPDNVTIDSIVLTGFEGCDIIFPGVGRAGIINGFKEMSTMIGGEENEYREWQYYDIDWKSAAAIENFGPGYQNLDYRAGVQKNMNQLATMDYAWWFGWRLHVRCDDPDNTCLCTPSNTIAYTIHDDPYKNHINFCPKYFELLPLDTAVSAAASYASTRDRLELYFNRAAAWAHEALHVSWLGTSVGFSQPWITDERVESSDGSTSWAAYRTIDTKYLAFSSDVAGFESVNNPQSYAWFGLANYVQRLKGFYPSQSIWLTSDDPPAPPPNADSPLNLDAYGEGNFTSIALPSGYCATRASVSSSATVSVASSGVPTNSANGTSSAALSSVSATGTAPARLRRGF